MYMYLDDSVVVFFVRFDCKRFRTLSSAKFTTGYYTKTLLNAWIVDSQTHTAANVHWCLFVTPLLPSKPGTCTRALQPIHRLTRVSDNTSIGIGSRVGASATAKAAQPRTCVRVAS